MRQGKSLENLVCHLETILAENDNVRITSPKRLRDRTNGRLREHDIVLNIKQGHHEIQLAIECRDHSRPITVNQVEGFWKKCSDTGIDQGVIVSAKGFYKSAQDKAEHLGIRCLRLNEVRSFGWLSTHNLEIYEREMVNVDWTFVPVENVEATLGRPLITDGNGVEIDRNILLINVKKEFEKLPIKTPDLTEQTVRFIFPAQSLFISEHQSSQKFQVKHVVVDIQYKVTRKFTPFTLVKYTDSKAEGNITEAALAKVDGLKGQLVFSQAEDKSIRLSFLFEEKE